MGHARTSNCTPLPHQQISGVPILACAVAGRFVEKQTRSSCPGIVEQLPRGKRADCSACSLALARSRASPAKTITRRYMLRMKETVASRKKKAGTTAKAIETVKHTESKKVEPRKPESGPLSEQKSAVNVLTAVVEAEMNGSAIPASRPNSGKEDLTEETEKATSRPDTAQEAAEAEDGIGALPHLGGSTTVRTRRKKLKKLTVNLSLCKYKVIRDVMEELGWKETEHETDWHLLWTDMSVSENRCMKLRRPQRLSHFPAMHHIARKCQLARNLDRLKQVLPELYDFHPETFNLPVDRQGFERCLAATDPDSGKKLNTFIVKPDDGACGQGIFMTRKAAAVPHTLSCVAQRYLENPLLIDGRKFDLRLYVLVTSMHPLRAYLHHQGLARFASDKYEKVTKENMKKTYMHLTNYSLNKHHPDFQVVEKAKQGAPVQAAEEGEPAEAVGGKRSAEWVREWLAGNGFDVGRVWGEIEEVIVKTLLAVQPYVGHTYKACIPDNRDSAGFSCFDLLGFDVMLDDGAKPWLIEVNEMPSWETASELDREVKHAVLKEALQMVCPTIEECRLLASPATTAPLPSLAGAAGAVGSDSGEQRAAESDGTRWKEAMARLRSRQEHYYARGFRRIFPLGADAAADDSRPNTAGTSVSVRSKPLAWQATGWAFLGDEDGAGVACRAATYARCLAAAEDVFSKSLWLQLGRTSLGAAKRECARGEEGGLPQISGGAQRAEVGGVQPQRKERERESEGGGTGRCCAVGKDAAAGGALEGARGSMRGGREGKRTEANTTAGSWKGGGKGMDSGGGKRGEAGQKSEM